MAVPRDSLRAHHGAGLIFRLRQWLLGLRLALARTRLGRMRYHASRFRFVPPHLHLADPSVAGDFLSGQIALAGRSLLAGGRDVLDLAPPSIDFSVALHGFDWLRHFDASGDPFLRAGARRILAQWLDRREAGTLPEANLPGGIPRRVIAWVTHSGLIAEKADLTTYRRLLAHLARDASMLQILAQRRDIGILGLECAIALLVHALSLDLPLGAIRRAETILLTALAEGIETDGGPKNRDAGSAVVLAADLIPLLALYRARQLPAPEAISSTLLGMIGFIRMMQHPDGGLAQFSGAGLVTRDLVAQVTRFGAGRVARLDSAPETGFERLEDDNGIIIADTGHIPPPAFGNQAGASALAFEFSTKFDRIIVNCGMPPSADAETARSFRTGPAHSTVLIDDHALASIEPVETILGSLEYHVTSEDAGTYPDRRQINGQDYLTIGHAGLRRATGYVVERRLSLLPGGNGLVGVDRMIDIDQRSENRRITLAFHLHPRALAVPLSRQDAVVLRLPHQSPGRDMWIFEAPGIGLHLEESRCFEQSISLPKTEAIVLDVAISGTTEISWRLIPYRG